MCVYESIVSMAVIQLEWLDCDFVGITVCVESCFNPF